MAIFRVVDCPVCGNNTKVRSDYNIQKCANCERRFVVDFAFTKHGKPIVDVSMEEYIPSFNFRNRNASGKKQNKIMSRNDWEAHDIYG